MTMRERLFFYRDDADSFVLSKSACLPYLWGRLLLYDEESVSALYIGSIFPYEGECHRECLSSGECEGEGEERGGEGSGGEGMGG